jgi:hypothetical protein
VLGHYKLRLGFRDGSTRDVDLTGELRGPVFVADANGPSQVSQPPLVAQAVTTPVARMGLLLAIPGESRCVSS